MTANKPPTHHPEAPKFPSVEGWREATGWSFRKFRLSLPTLGLLKVRIDETNHETLPADRDQRHNPGKTARPTGTVTVLPGLCQNTYINLVSGSGWYPDGHHCGTTRLNAPTGRSP